jgi:tetratricopeptide (TPR) repeat protein
MKAVVALLVLLMSISAVAQSALVEGEFDPMTGISLQDEFTLKFLPISSKGDLPALKALLEEKERTLAEEGEGAMLLYQIGLLHFFIGDRYAALGKGEGVLHHADETVRVLERAMELGLERRYLPFAHASAGYAIGTKAEHVGILASLGVLGTFDRHITIAIRLGKEYYGPVPALSLMHAVRGRRFRDTPWFVGGSNRRAMEYFRKAVELDPGYLGNYVDIALTYERMGEYNKAIEYWLPLQERYLQWGTGAKEQAEEALKRLRG